MIDCDEWFFFLESGSIGLGGSLEFWIWGVGILSITMKCGQRGGLRKWVKLDWIGLGWIRLREMK